MVNPIEAVSGSQATSSTNAYDQYIAQLQEQDEQAQATTTEQPQSSASSHEFSNLYTQLEKGVMNTPSHVYRHASEENQENFQAANALSQQSGSSSPIYL